MPEPIEFDESGHLVLRLKYKRILKVFVILCISFLSYYTPIEGLSEAARICLVIFVGAAGLWVTEAIPPFATAILVVVLNIYLLGQPGGLLGLEGSGVLTSYRIFINPIASPVLVLFFGGFILAIAASKHGMDLRMAKAFIKPFGTKPKMVLMGVIVITALFSMFISNTATTAMMFAIFTPLFKHFEERDAFKKALVLAIPFAANIGGMGTIIGTPPNAVAASILAGLGFQISFLKWMAIGVPIVIVLLFLLWILLMRSYRPKTEQFEILFPEEFYMTWDLLTVMITFGVTVFLWLTEPLHGIPAAVVALLPVMIFTMFGIINRDDLKKIEWDVLILVAGGLALGVSMSQSGLSDVLVQQISLGAVSPVLLLIFFMIVTVIISNFMSNTSASNLLIPIVTAIAMIDTIVGAIAVAFAASLSMSLPISTPPNAIAFATRSVSTKEMAKSGTLISAIGIAVLIVLLFMIQNFFGII